MEEEEDAMEVEDSNTITTLPIHQSLWDILDPKPLPEVLDQPAGIELPQTIYEDMIIGWINQYAALIQYNDMDRQILDIRNPSEAALNFPLNEPLEFLPCPLVLTAALFAVFCDYFNLDPMLVSGVKKMALEQSVVIMTSHQMPWLMVFPYFKNVNYYHYEVQRSTSLGDLIRFQDQAMILNVSRYPLAQQMDIVEQRQAMMNLYTAPDAPQRENSKRVNREEEEEENIITTTTTTTISRVYAKRPRYLD